MPPDLPVPDAPDIDALARNAVDLLLAPGLVFFQTLGLPADTETGLLACLLIGYACWYRLLRFSWFALGRLYGFASISHYHAWTRFWIDWRTPFHGWLEVRRTLRHNATGDGPNQYWAGWWETASYCFNAARGDIPVGRIALLHRIGLHLPVGLPDGEKSVSCISYAGGGKSAWLATWLGCLPKQGAAVVFDMDGAFVNAFGAVLQAAGHKVTKIDPDRVNKSFPGGTWNPLHELTVAARRHGNASVFAFAETLAHALIVQDSATQPVFANTARVIVHILIVYAWLFEKDKSLRRVKQLLTRAMPERIEGDEDAFEAMLFMLSDLPAAYARGEIDDGAGGLLCEAIANNCGLISGAHDTNAGSPDNFRKVAIYQMLWVDDPNVVPVICSDSDTTGEAHKLSNHVTFIVSTLDDTQKRLAPLVRAFTMMALYAFQRTAPDMKLKHPCLFLLDEFPNLGRMDSVATAAPGFRKFGVRLVTVSQSIGLLRATYPEKYREFLNQSGCVVWMGIAPTDTETLQYLSKDVLGECVVKEKVQGFHWLTRMLLRPFGFRNLPPEQFIQKPQRLMTEGQASSFLDRSTGQMIVTREGRAPMRLQRLVYWRDLAVWQYGVHKGHGERFLRRQTREIVSLVGAPALMALLPIALLAAYLSGFAATAAGLLTSALETGGLP